MIEYFSQPIVGIPLTLCAYLSGVWLYRRLGHSNLVQPVMTAIFVIACVLLTLDIPYAAYSESAGIIHFLLGTATVALALPLYDNLDRIRLHFWPLTLTLLVSGIVAAGSALLLAWLGGADEALLRSLAPKSITTPFAIGVAEQIGGYPALTASFVIITGIIVALAGPPLLRLLRIDSPVAAGCAMGMLGHGIGTARSFEMNSTMGAFSALSMSLMGIYTALGLGFLLG